MFDVFAIKTESKNGSAVGYLPKEVSRITRFILDQGAKVTATRTSTHFCCSLLVHGGLEIACKVTVKIPAAIKNHIILHRFKELVNDFYTEPTDEEILGSFLATVSHNFPIRIQETPPFQRKKKKMVKFRINVSDIREMSHCQVANGH